MQSFRGQLDNAKDIKIKIDTKIASSSSTSAAPNRNTAHQAPTNVREDLNVWLAPDNFVYPTRPFEC